MIHYLLWNFILGCRLFKMQYVLVYKNKKETYEETLESGEHF